MSVTYFLFEETTILSILSRLFYMGATPSVRSPILFTALPILEQSEEFMAPNHSEFAVLEEDHFRSGTRALSAHGKVGSFYLKRKIRRDCWKFLEDSVNCVLSTVAARSVEGQGLSGFPPPILVSGNDHTPIQLFDMLLDGLLEKRRVRSAEMEACKSECQSFVQEQRQVEWTWTRSRPDIGSVPTSSYSQASFRVRRHLCKICIASKHVRCSLVVVSGSFMFRFRPFN